jgi:hypothetical protein
VVVEAVKEMVDEAGDETVDEAGDETVVNKVIQMAV